MQYGLGNCFEQRQCFCNVSEWYCVSVNVIFEKTPFLYGFPPLSPSHVTGNATSVHRWIELIKTKKMVYHYRGSHARWLRSEGGGQNLPPPLYVRVTRIDLYVRVLTVEELPFLYCNKWSIHIDTNNVLHQGAARNMTNVVTFLTRWKTTIR